MIFKIHLTQEHDQIWSNLNKSDYLISLKSIAIAEILKSIITAEWWRM